jgi:molybdopterin-guanine dinucleotide biosynthesis protein A
MIMQMIAKIKTIYLSFEHHKDSFVNLNYQDMWEMTKYKKSILFEGYY